MADEIEGLDYRLLDKCPHGQAYLCDICGGPVGEALRPDGARRPLWRGPRPPLYLDADGNPVYDDNQEK